MPRGRSRDKSGRGPAELGPGPGPGLGLSLEPPARQGLWCPSAPRRSWRTSAWGSAPRSPSPSGSASRTPRPSSPYLGTREEEEARATKTARGGGWRRRGRGRQAGGKKGGILPPAAEAAYRLLQWAEYGDVPSFMPPGDGLDGGEGGNEPGDGAGDHSAEPPAWAESVLASGGSVAPSANDRAASGPGPKPTPPSPPEESDPDGLRPGLALRPYQRQALHWMLCREGGPTNRADVVRELELLSELADDSSSTSRRSGASLSPYAGAGAGAGACPSQDVTCDCGPVRVSEDVALRSLTIHGAVDPPRHPLWQRRFLATDGCRSAVAFYVNEVLGVATASPPDPPRQCVGGILADSMGLGKTVMLLSLILKSKESKGMEGPPPPQSVKAEGAKEGNIEVPIQGSRSKERCKDPDQGASETECCELVVLSSEDECEGDGINDSDYDPNEPQPQPSLARYPSLLKPSTGGGTTIVIAPLSLISQWEEEVLTKTNMSCRVHYGESRNGATSSGFNNVDIVLTTYGAVQSEYLASSTDRSLKSRTQTPILSHAWERAILDEAQLIKNPATAISKACCALLADKRWCITGTPVQNSLQDIYGLLKFLQHEPWCSRRFWNTAITDVLTEARPEESSTNVVCGGSANAVNGMAIAMDRVKRLIAPLILRRTKDTVGVDGRPILSLPTIDSSVVTVVLSDPEREFYNQLLSRSQDVFEGFIKAGTASKSWLAIFSLIQRLRQACDHVALTVNSRIRPNNVSILVDSKTRDESTDAERKPPSHSSASNDSFLTGLLNMFQESSSHLSAMATTSSSDGGGDEGVDGSSAAFMTQVAKSIQFSVQDDGRMKEECPLCLEHPDITDVALTPCAHAFCKDCLRSFINRNTGRKGAPRNALGCADGSCPVCGCEVEASNVIVMGRKESGKVTLHRVADIVLPQEATAATAAAVSTSANAQALAARETLIASLSGGISSKVSAVLGELDNIWQLDPGSKILIFSQFLGMIDLLGMALSKKEVPTFRLDGKMSLKERIAALDRFERSKGAKPDSAADAVKRGAVFLASMKAGGVGINLVAASSVLIVDPWWNAAVEDQCISRIHRIGQKAAVVRVRKFVVDDSVEEKMVKLQMSKKALATDLLASEEDSSELSGTKPTLEDFKILLGQ